MCILIRIPNVRKFWNNSNYKINNHKRQNKTDKEIKEMKSISKMMMVILIILTSVYTYL